MNARTVATAYYEVRDRDGKPVRAGDNIKVLKASLGRGHTVWHVAPVMRVLVTQTVHGKDKVSSVKGTFRSCRIGGEHTSTLTHNVVDHWEATRFY